MLVQMENFSLASMQNPLLQWTISAPLAIQQHYQTNRRRHCEAVDCNGRQTHDTPMRKIIVYAIGATASLFILGYTVHMFLGGLVSTSAEQTAIAVVVAIGAAVIGWMTWDIARRK